ncbi:MAG: hypothetical protein EA350_14860 [Gemmatimonadales bacterium]|nr:MAG: hypothetical protein EA350_14860 [Gemmatimonadales bacterium]
MLPSFLRTPLPSNWSPLPASRPASRPAPRPAPVLAPLLALAFVLTSCGGDTVHAGLAEGDRPLDIAVEDVYRVGSIDGNAWDSFTRVSSMAFGDDSRLHILDPAQRRIHVVSETGEHLRSFGTRGEGPGEFRSPVGVQVLADDRIVVADNGHQAFLVFSSEGVFLASHPYDAGGSMPGARLQRQGDDAVIAHGQGMRLEAVPGGGPPALPTTTPVDRWRLAPGDVVVRDRLLEAWRPERDPPRQQAGSGAGGVMVMRSVTLALEPAVHVAALPDGRLALADSSAYRIRIFGPGGHAEGPPRVVGRDIAPVPVGPAEEEAERERRLAQLESGGGPQIQIATSGPGGGGQQEVPQEQIRDMLRAQMAAMSFWHEIPVITRLAADAEGRLWVERSAGIGEDGPVDLLEADGTYLGSIAPGNLRTPLAFGPGGVAAWVELDELEVPFVRVGRIRIG